MFCTPEELLYCVCFHYWSVHSILRGGYIDPSIILTPHFTTFPMYGTCKGGFPFLWDFCPRHIFIMEFLTTMVVLYIYQKTQSFLVNRMSACTSHVVASYISVIIAFILILWILLVCCYGRNSSTAKITLWR